MVKCVLIDTSYPINTRNEKILKSLKDSFPDIVVKIITWDRCHNAPKGLKDYYFYDGNVSLGNRVKKFLYLRRFKRYVQLIIKEEEPNLIIASHWDALYTLPNGVNKTAFVVYENLDIPDGSLFAIKVGTLLEKKALRNADIITHASRFFVKLFQKSPKQQLVLENKPVFSNIERKASIGNPFIISFLGNIRYLDILENLVNAVNDDNRFEVHFYGGGPDYEALHQYCKNFKNVKLFGKYNYNEIQDLYRKSDLIWAVYPNKDYNVRYAISNKFYESMYLGVPCVYANNTKLGDFVEQNGIGYIVDPYDVCAIKKLLNSIIENKNNYSKVEDTIYEFANKETTWDYDFLGLVEKIKESGKI